MVRQKERAWEESPENREGDSSVVVHVLGTQKVQVSPSKKGSGSWWCEKSKSGVPLSVWVDEADLDEAIVGFGLRSLHMLVCLFIMEERFSNTYPSAYHTDLIKKDSTNRFLCILFPPDIVLLRNAFFVISYKQRAIERFLWKIGLWSAFITCFAVILYCEKRSVIQGPFFWDTEKTMPSPIFWGGAKPSCASFQRISIWL